MVNNNTISEKEIWDLLATVSDPEIPVLSIIDLGIVRAVRIENNIIKIIITPTYTGCPAMDMIAMNIKLTMLQYDINNFEIITILAPAWTTDWMTDLGKQKLKEYGIAAPNKTIPIPEDGVECPLCNSTNTRVISEFGSTACKALYQCNNCKEPFDYFKCH